MKSSRPHRASTLAKKSSIWASSPTSSGSMKLDLDRLRQGMNPFLQRLAEIVEPELGPLAVTGPGHAPCDGFLVGDAEDQPFPALQNAHETLPGFDLAPILTRTRRSAPNFLGRP